MTKIRTRTKGVGGQKGSHFPVKESGSKNDKDSPFKDPIVEEKEFELALPHDFEKDAKNRTYHKVSAKNLDEAKKKIVGHSTDRADKVIDKVDNEPTRIGGLSPSQRKLVEKKVDSEIEGVVDGNYGYGKIFQFDNNEEWYIFDSEKHAEDTAIDLVKEELGDEPEIFNQDWLDNFMEVSDTDARLLARDFADSLVDDRELDELQDVANSFEVPFSDDDKEDELREKISDKVADDYEEKIKDNFKDFICNDEGLCTEEDFFKDYGKWLHIDIDSASEDAIATDGIAHFLAGYDGEEVELSDGTVMYRTN